MNSSQHISRSKIAILFAMIFLVGALAGSVATRFYIHNQLKSMARGNLSGKRARVMRRLTRRLNLTSEQQQKVKKIVTESQQKLMALRNRHFEDVRRIFDESEEKIKAQLTPRQQVELEKMYSQVKRRWQDRAGRAHRNHRRRELAPWHGR